MNRSRLLILLLLTCLAPAMQPAFAQQGDGSSQALPQGTEYYVTFLQNEDDRGAATKFMGLMISSEVATSGLVEIPNGTSKPFSTQPGQITMVPISRDFELKQSEDFPIGAIRITSRAPVVVFAVNSLFQSMGGYAVLPPDLWARSYAPMTLPNADGKRVSEFAVIAMHDSTRLNLFPSTATEKLSAWQERQINLNRGETFLMKAYRGNTGVADLSLSDVIGSRPFAVVSGHVRTPIAANGEISSNDWASHQEIMPLPDSLWSSDYITVPMRPEGDRFRLIVAQDQTKLLITHYPPGGGVQHQQLTLNRGDIYDSSTSNGMRFTGPVHWSANAPFMLVQMRTSGRFDNNPENAPAMVPVYGLDRISSRSVFVAPSELGLDFFTKHTLTIIAKGEPTAGAADPTNPLRNVKLNGTPVHTLAPELLTQRIGTTNYYYVRLMVDAGGHVLTSTEGYPVTGTISGSNGTLARDSYAWSLPFWIPAPPGDVAAPYIFNTVVLAENRLKVIFSDHTESYFSGLLDVVIENSPGWRMEAPFSPPVPDANGEAIFQVIGDPSGPLYVKVRDRAGNETTLKLHDGICAKSAYASANYIKVETSSGTQKEDSILIWSSPCGAPAEIRDIIFSNESLRQYITTSFQEGPGPGLMLQSNDTTALRLVISPNAPIGTHKTRITLPLDVSMIELDVDLVVQPPASVGKTFGENALEVSVTPNPVTSSARILFGRPLGDHARVRVVDYLGRSIRTFNAEAIAGAGHATWDGLGDDGTASPAGVYFIVVEDGGRRGLATATLVR